MARKKVIVAIEDIQPDTLRPESFKYLSNFICYAEQLPECIENAALRDVWKEDRIECDNDRDAIVKYWNDNKKALTFHYDEVAAYEAKLTSKVKLTDEYIYRVRCMDFNNVANEVYCTFNEIFPQIEKRIKNKYAIVWYDGHREKIEYSTEAISNLVKAMSPKTNAITICQLLRDGEEGESLMITTYKNFLKKQ